MKKWMLVASILFFFLSPLSHAKSERTRIELGDRTVEGLIDSPKGEGPHPFLIIAAGEDVSVSDRFYEKLTAAATAADFVTLRLDWSFKRAKGKASPDLKREAEELGTVINDLMTSRMMKHFEIDTTKVALIAKGLGAKVAMVPESGATSDKVKATLLLGPDCDGSPDSFAKTYAPFLSAKTSRMIIAVKGGACPLNQIYSAGKSFSDEVTLFTMASDSPDAAIGAAGAWLKAQGWSKTRAVSATPDLRKHTHDAQAAGMHP